MLKDKAYWQAYNQKRKAYLTFKKRESRQRIKAQSTTLLDQNLVSTTILEKVVDLQVVDLAGVVDHQVVDQASKVVDHNRSPVVDRQEVVDTNPKQVVDRVVDHPILTQLIQIWKTSSNYSCPPTCAYSYCNNCWYFYQNELINYKEAGM